MVRDKPQSHGCTKQRKSSTEMGSASSDGILFSRDVVCWMARYRYKTLPDMFPEIAEIAATLGEICTYWDGEDLGEIEWEKYNPR
jgi:hypothetical protein